MNEMTHVRLLTHPVLYVRYMGVGCEVLLVLWQLRRWRPGQSGERSLSLCPTVYGAFVIIRRHRNNRAPVTRQNRVYKTKDRLTCSALRLPYNTEPPCCYWFPDESTIIFSNGSTGSPLNILGDIGAKRTCGAKWSPFVFTYLMTWLESKYSVREALT